MAVEHEPVEPIYTQIEKNPIQIDWIPGELIAYPQWVCWRLIDRGRSRKPDKQPVNPRQMTNAGIHWANTWNTFDKAYATYLQYHNTSVHGVGLVSTLSDPFVAVEIDGCVEKDTIESPAAQVIHDLGSYTEVSPSGQGIRILLACPEFYPNGYRETIEVYSHR